MHLRKPCCLVNPRVHLLSALFPPFPGSCWAGGVSVPAAPKLSLARPLPAGKHSWEKSSWLYPGLGTSCSVWGHKYNNSTLGNCHPLPQVRDGSECVPKPCRDPSITAAAAAAPRAASHGPVPQGWWGLFVWHVRWALEKCSSKLCAILFSAKWSHFRIEEVQRKHLMLILSIIKIEKGN